VTRDRQRLQLRPGSVVKSVRTGRGFGNHLDVQWPRTPHRFGNLRHSGSTGSSTSQTSAGSVSKAWVSSLE
jgi:hypothetical protein